MLGPRYYAKWFVCIVVCNLHITLTLWGIVPIFQVRTEVKALSKGTQLVRPRLAVQVCLIGTLFLPLRSRNIDPADSLLSDITIW